MEDRRPVRLFPLNVIDQTCPLSAMRSKWFPETVPLYILLEPDAPLVSHIACPLLITIFTGPDAVPQDAPEPPAK